MGDWWQQNLRAYFIEGQEDAEEGKYDPPWPIKGTAAYDEDENLAYQRGWDSKQKELKEGGNSGH